MIEQCLVTKGGDQKMKNVNQLSKKTVIYKLNQTQTMSMKTWSVYRGSVIVIKRTIKLK